jgi:hypothetical protein
MTEFFTSRFATIQTFLSTQSFPTKDWLNIFSWSYWTEGQIGSFTPYYAFGFGLLFVLLLALEIWRRKLKKAHQAAPIYGTPLVQISNLFYFLLLMVPTYWFFRTQQISYLSSRLVLGFTVLIAIGWLLWIAIILKRRLPLQRRSYLEKERFFRYLPTNSASDSVQTRKKGNKK